MSHRSLHRRGSRLLQNADRFLLRLVQLGVSVDADDTELKKAYRKQAIKVRRGLLPVMSFPLLILLLLLVSYHGIHIVWLW